MAGGIPPTYRAGANALANYSYTDIAGGVGVIDFHGATISGAKAYILTTNSAYSNDVYTKLATANETYNFDVVFNLPRVAKGTAYLELPLAVYHASVTGKTISGAVILQKISSGVTTNFGTGASGVLSGGGSGQTYSKTMAIPIPLTQTHFKKGDTLRCSVTISAAGGATANYIGHDPKARRGKDSGVIANDDVFGILATNDGSSEFDLFIPFVIDL